MNIYKDKKRIYKIKTYKNSYLPQMNNNTIFLVLMHTWGR